MANSRRILVVEDDADMREALVEQLALHDEFEAVSVDTGTQAVQSAKAGEVDLVIMDVGLPDIDGREAVRMSPPSCPAMPPPTPLSGAPSTKSTPNSLPGSTKPNSLHET